MLSSSSWDTDNTKQCKRRNGIERRFEMELLVLFLTIDEKKNQWTASVHIDKKPTWDKKQRLERNASFEENRSSRPRTR